MRAVGTGLAVAGLDGDLPPAWSDDLPTGPVPDELAGVLAAVTTAVSAEPAGGVDALLVTAPRPWLLLGVGTTVRGRPRGDGSRATALAAEAVQRAGSPVPVRVLDLDALPRGERVRLVVRAVEHEQQAGRTSTSYRLPLVVWVAVVGGLLAVGCLLALADGAAATAAGLLLAALWVAGTLLAVAQWGDVRPDPRRRTGPRQGPALAGLGTLALLAVVVVRVLDAARG